MAELTSLTDHFDLEEFLRSDKAEELGIVQVATVEIRANLTTLAQGPLEAGRAVVGALFVSSGFRDSRVNMAVGGSPTSQHMTGQAADVVPLAKGKTIFDLLEALARLDQERQARGERGHLFDQIIVYFNPNKGIVHVSFVSYGANRGQIKYSPRPGVYVRVDADQIHTVRERFG